MYERYAGEFVSTYGTVWRVEIHEEAETAFSTVGELSFPYDEPLLIEWEKKAKEEVIQGSSATLKLISPGDRTYVDLYSVKPCAVRLDVYRDGALYWRGTLDTELYEEPYESASGYTVSLTFSDFGVLARKKLYGHEVQSLRSILERALEAAGLAGMEIYDGYISSRVVPAARLVPETNGPTGASSQAEAQAPTSSAASRGSEGAQAPTGLLDELYVSGDNFYDEDGEAITAEEVVEGVLQPLALRMIQCGGLVYVYDLNGLHAGAEKVMLEWAGATQTLGTDRVYNNVRVKWSPYVRTGNLLETDCWTAAVDAGLTDFGPEYILDGGRPSADGKCRYTTYHYTTDSDVWGDETDAGFTLWTSRTGKNADLTDERVRYFKVVPQNGGTECEGVAVMYTAVGMYGDSSDKSLVLGCMGVMPDELHAGTPKGVLFKSRAARLLAGSNGAQAAARLVPETNGAQAPAIAKGDAMNGDAMNRVSTGSQVSGSGNAGSAQGDGHVHANKGALDKLGVTDDGYVTVTDMPGAETVTEKAKAGYADTAGTADEAKTLTEDSEVWDMFVSRLKDDVVKGNISFEKAIAVAGLATLAGGLKIGNYGIDKSGKATLAEVAATLMKATSAEAGRLKVTEAAEIVLSLLKSADFVSGATGKGVAIQKKGDSWSMEIDELLVRKIATFLKLEIRELSYVGGNIVLSKAGNEITKVEKVSGGWKCSFTSNEGDEVQNMWKAGDQARCQTFGDAMNSVSTTVSTKYYWRLVTEVGEDYVVLSETDYDTGVTNSEPAAGDKIVQMGFRLSGDEGDKDRTSLIILSTSGENTPSIEAYTGVVSYELSAEKRLFILSPGEVSFRCSISNCLKTKELAFKR